MLSLSRLTGLLAGCVALYIAWRVITRLRTRVGWWRGGFEEVRALVLSAGAFAAFVVAGAGWTDRPMASLAGRSGDELTVEIHSHTTASHDVRGLLAGRFSAEASRRWHRRAGVDVLFITDHNVTGGWAGATARVAPDDTQICPGVEISAHRAHVVVLGSPPADPAGYRRGVEQRARLFADVAATPTAVAIASLPEYRGQVAEFIAAGVRGFEIVNASPKGNELPRHERDSIMTAARAHGLLLVGAGDQHGYGATPMVWNLVELPGQRLATDSPCERLVERFRSGGSDAVRVVERTRLRPDHPLPRLLTPAGVLWVAWTTMPLAAVPIWLGWIWLTVVALKAVRRRPPRPLPTPNRFLVTRAPPPFTVQRR